MLLLPKISVGGSPIVTSLVEDGKEVRRSEVFTPRITIQVVSTGIVLGGFLAVGGVMSVLPA